MPLHFFKAAKPCGFKYCKTCVILQQLREVLYTHWLEVDKSTPHKDDLAFQDFSKKSKNFRSCDRSVKSKFPTSKDEIKQILSLRCNFMRVYLVRRYNNYILRPIKDKLAPYFHDLHSYEPWHMTLGNVPHFNTINGQQSKFTPPDFLLTDNLCIEFLCNYLCFVILHKHTNLESKRY